MARLAPTALVEALEVRASLAVKRDRRLSGRRLASYFTWMFWGSVGTYVDGIHEAFGVVAYLLDDGDMKAVLAWGRRRNALSLENASSIGLKSVG